MPLKREVTPPGPISLLFDRLHELYLHAGEPGVRHIAAGCGRGVISYTTVHNVFRGPRVPRWGPLELIVEQLGGDVASFREWWKAARSDEMRRVAAFNGPLPVPVPVGIDERRHAMVMVSHHLPGEEFPTRDQPTAWPTAGGGIVDALLTLLRRQQGIWVGWAAGKSPAQPSVPVRSIEFSTEETQQHYHGYCSSTIWPLYHCATAEPDFDPALHLAHLRVNERFAEAVAEVAAPGATVWVQDYHMQPAPAMIRRRRPDVMIGYFLHIPFPPVEVFRRLPGREAILRGLLGADLIGFQDALSADNFQRAVTALLGLPVHGDQIPVDGRITRLGVFPVAVDTTTIANLATRPSVSQRAQTIRADLGDPRTVFSGIDRLDHNKGLVDRLKAYGEVLAEGRLAAESTAFVQFTRTHKESVPGYADLRARIERLAGSLNGEYGRVGRPVVHYSRNSLGFDEIVALYLATDVMVVTPLSDGMNLIAKEYVASRTDDTGVLILSEFAGAARELDTALIINPYDEEGMKAALVRAAKMEPVEQRERISHMRRQVARRDIHHWVTSFLDALQRPVR